MGDGRGGDMMGVEEVYEEEEEETHQIEGRSLI